MAKAIMIQGTMSNAGKSLIAAGLCRIFRQDGYRVAPFKSQNMALNSFITREGLEMGRAQVVQAQAAGIEPLACMNPILLKPVNDTGSQVIVNGVPIGNMAAREYFRYKKELLPVIKSAYEKLAAQYDIIVIEGAGSPAEINLKQDDIVNMGMARMADAPVLLVGDIDRGGVFAQLYGTVELLEKEEQDRICGLIINKFRGDPSILTPGVKMIEELLGIPVVGVTPYMELDIEDEDSLSSRLESGNGDLVYGGNGGNPQEGKRRKDGGREDGGRQIGRQALADIAVIRFPRLSNFTDFDAFGRIQGTAVRYVDRAARLGTPDLVILPGTKNTVEDLLWMRQNGLEAAILKLASRGTPVFGICGGYQMMGRRLLDEEGAESGREGTRLDGMGLLGVTTQFTGEKVRTRVRGRFLTVGGPLSGLSGLELEGYEIHMGRTWPMAGGTPLTEITGYQENATKGAAPDGCQSGNCYGTYVHGIFDRTSVAAEVVRSLLVRKGLPPELLAGAGGAGPETQAYRETQFDRLAEGLKRHLDMKKIYEILREDREK